MKPVMIENARLLFKNFAGKEATYNAKGIRNFCVVLDNEIAAQMKLDGWNIRYLKSRDEDEDDQAYIQVTVRFDPIPPEITMISSRGRTVLDEESVSTLDYAEMETVDLTISPYQYTVQGRTGVKAYLKKMFVTLVEDPLEMKYRNNQIADISAPGESLCQDCNLPCGSQGACRHDD